MTSPNAPSVPVDNWAYARCALNSCRERVLADEYDEHQVEKHYDHDELVEAATSYILLRNVIIERFNPTDDDVAEIAIMLGAVNVAADALEASSCQCTPADVEDHRPCQRCQALGRLGDAVESR
jgi:hypothetical protein